MRVYIGIETKVREFDAKLLLSCVAAEAGYDVILGQQRLLKRKLEDMPQGIYIDKSVAASKATRHARLKKLGFHVAAYDEEGLVFFNPEEYLKRRVSPETFKQVGYFFAWGPRHVEVVSEKMPADKDKIVPAGHPRVDLTREELRAFYDEDVRKLRERYGRFILINTNFALYNHARGKDVAIEILAKGGKIADEEHRQYYLSAREHKKQLFYAFADMVKGLHERFPDVSIVLRPHPAEDHAYWRQIVPQNGTIHVLHEGNVLPWLLAAEAIIHNSCTTGIEAYLLGRPVIAYQPIQNKAIDVQLPNSLSEEVLTRDALLERLEQWLNQGWTGESQASPQKQELIEQYITGLDGPFSCDRIITALGKIPPHSPSWQVLLYRAYRKMRKAGRILLKGREQTSPEAPAQLSEEAKYHLQKFPGIEVEEIQRSIRKFHQLTGRFADIQVRQLEKNLFQIVSGEQKGN